MQVSPRRRWRSCTYAFLATAVLVAPATVSAKGKRHNASAPKLSAPIAQGVAGPLQLVVDGRSIYVSQAFAGLLTKFGPGGSRTDVASNPGSEIAGVDVGRHHEVFYTSSTSDPSPTSPRRRPSTV